MKNFVKQRIIASLALVAFLFAFAAPAMAVVRYAIDPVAFAKVCSPVESIQAAANGETPAPGGKVSTQHCLTCVGSATTPFLFPEVSGASLVPRSPVIIVVSADAPPVVSGMAALQPLNPRAPPRT